jgi:IS5 family transposase
VSGTRHMSLSKNRRISLRVNAIRPGWVGVLLPAVRRIKERNGRPPRMVTADRGYGEALEKRRAFRRTIKWRTGCEGRISTLKRGYGWDRTRLDILEGAKTWTGQGIFTHNLIKIATITA